MRTGRHAGRTVGIALLALMAIVGSARHASAGCNEGVWTAEELRAASARLTGLISQERAERGLGPVTAHTRIASVAGEHARRMADAGTIFHNDAYFGMHKELNASALGENVALGCSAEDRHDAFMESPPHRANILDARFNHVGIGVAADADGWLYVVEGFAAVRAAAPPPAPAAAAAPAPPSEVSATPAPPTPAPATPQPTPVATPAPPADAAVGIDSDTFERIEAAPADPDLDASAEGRGATGVVAPAMLLAAIAFALVGRRPKRRTAPVPAVQATLLQRPEGKIVQVRSDAAFKGAPSGRR